MLIAQTMGHAPRVTSVARQAARLPLCIDCDGCTGICPTLMDLIALPDAVLNRPRR